MPTVTTTLSKEYIIRRDGVPISDQSTMIEHWLRHGDYLTIAQIVTDPVCRPSRSSRRPISPSTCTSGTHLNSARLRKRRTIQQAGCRTACQGRRRMPRNFAKKHGLPVEAVRGGAETTYPEYEKAEAGRPH
jgi:hypothetical protein